MFLRLHLDSCSGVIGTGVFHGRACWPCTPVEGVNCRLSQVCTQTWLRLKAPTPDHGDQSVCNFEGDVSILDQVPSTSHSVPSKDLRAVVWGLVRARERTKSQHVTTSVSTASREKPGALQQSDQKSKLQFPSACRRNRYPR